MVAQVYKMKTQGAGEDSMEVRAYLWADYAAIAKTQNGNRLQRGCFLAAHL